MSTAPTTVIAYTGEDRRYGPVTSYAAETAKASSAMLILYDIDAAGMQAPLPTDWSAEGTQELHDSGRLNAEMLEAAGRQELAGKVRKYESEGLEVYGWLPQSSSIDSLADYAESQGADLIVVPSQSDHRTLLDRFRGRDTDDLADHTTVAVAVVDEEEGVAVH